MMTRPERRSDHASIDAVVTLAFDDPRIARLVELIRSSERYVPELALVADDGGEVVAHVMLSYATLERPEPPLAPVLLLSPMSVAPAYQRRGIGDMLVRDVLARADRRREPMVVVEGIPTYYPRFGFEPARANGIEPPSPTIADEAFMVRKLSAYRDELRGRVVYPPAFDII
jgi:putative acetyltransferase